MDGGAKKLLESVTYETLHAQNFSRSSSQATNVLTDLLSRYLALLTTTCAKYAEHAGRLSISIRDAVSALDELGVDMDELSGYCASEVREVSRYAVHTARRVEDLGEFKAFLETGLREDRDDAIPLVYARVPSPMLDEDDEEEPMVYDEEEEEEPAQDATVSMDLDLDSLEDGSWLKGRDNGVDIFPPASPPLPLSPISNPSTPPRKRPRTASWRPDSYIPDFFPPFPTDSPRQSPSPPPQDTSAPANAIKLERAATPPPSQLTASTSSADYLTPIPYYTSALASVDATHLPAVSLAASDSSAAVASSSLPLPQVQPALFGAYHHVLTHPPPINIISVNPARYRVALAFLAEAEAHPRWEPAPTLFSNTAPNAPRVASMAPSFPVPVAKQSLTPTDGKPSKEAELEKDRKTNLPSVPPRSVVLSERVTPLLSQQPSRIPSLAREVLPGSVYTRTTRLTHPPVLLRGDQKLTYGPGINAPWNTNAPIPSPLVPAALKNKEGNANGIPNGKDVDAPAKPLPDARLYATWDYEQKRFNEPLQVRRGRISSMQTTVGMPPVRGRSESRVS